MDLRYSITLLVSLTAGALSQLAGLVALVRTWYLSPGEPGSSWSRRICRVATAGALVSVGFAIISVGVHLAFGHCPGSAEGLGPMAFLVVHPAYLGALAMAAMAALLSHLAKTSLESPRDEIL